VLGAARPHLLPVDQPTTLDPAGAGLDGRRVRPCVGLAEQLAPGELTVEGGADPALDLVGTAVLGEGQGDPAGDAHVGPLHTGQLLVDDELLDGAGGPAPRPGPVRDKVAGVNQGPVPAFEGEGPVL